MGWMVDLGQLVIVRIQGKRYLKGLPMDSDGSVVEGLLPVLHIADQCHVSNSCTYTP